MAEKKYKLLFVDDEEDILFALEDTFSDVYTIFRTTDPVEALEIAKKEEIALVISDQRMPEMTGSELLAEIYAVKPEIMRILLTGYADINAAVDAINKGAIHKYVEKPWDDEALIEMVAQLVTIYDEFMDNMSVLSDMEQIISNESTFKTILDTIKEGVCTISENSNLAFVNTSAGDMLGYTNADHPGMRTIFDVTDDDVADFRTEFKKNGKVKAKIFNATTKDKTPIDVLLTPIFEQDGEEIRGLIFQGI